MDKTAYFFCMTICHRRTGAPLGKRCGVVFAGSNEAAESAAWEKYGGDTACQLWVAPVPQGGFDFTVYKSLFSPRVTKNSKKNEKNRR